MGKVFVTYQFYHDDDTEQNFDKIGKLSKTILEMSDPLFGIQEVPFAKVFVSSL